ncbi:LysR family transcriptional regulator ArgP [Halopseudomonas yangmingensis]|uniref:LysR family transcriptional regulator, chromosome initiation inhibitor n=1 Tax=Halopseudomonas yangmingensis TaxID=1720063 RepID=A0A1I4TMB2_9GAMM|nr:LysR family transcriptional regulator ArgP [Halopseudomonas yangmingensis]SFM77763.1 LysR family transcriptional regulator, chromosome initiation inhibitor [Halopseudomonas yangmingensis]
MLDYPLLQAMAAVVETGSFERAAQRLCITQSAVSQRIKQLESRLGQPVLLRSSPPQPTALGRRLHNHLRQVQQMEQSIGLGEPQEQLTLRITVNADSLATWLPAALAMPDWPQVRYDISVEDQAVGLRRMKHGEVMACLCASAEPVNGGRAQYLGLLRYRALASPDFLQRYRQPQRPDWLAQAPCLVFNRDDRLQHDYLRQHQAAEPRHTHGCPGSEGFLRCAIEGIGWGLLPELQAREALAAGLLCEVLPDTPVDVPLYWHYWRAESPILAALRNSVVQVAARWLV